MLLPFNIVVCCDNPADVEHLRKFIHDSDYNYATTNSISHAHWRPSERPLFALVIGCKTKKDEFKLRLKFKTLSGLWMNNE